MPKDNSKSDVELFEFDIDEKLMDTKLKSFDDQRHLLFDKDARKKNSDDHSEFKQVFESRDQLSILSNSRNTYVKKANKKTS